MPSPWVCLLFLLSPPALTPAPAGVTADQIIQQVVARDKQLVQRRKAFDYDIAITREKLDENKAVIETIKDKVVITGDKKLGYGTRPAESDPKDEAKKTSQEEPFELLKIIDHYTYTLEGEEMADGVECYKIGFTPKPDMPYSNREEKVLNNVSGHIWASVKDSSLIRNEGFLMHPVSVAWIFATLEEMEFHFDSMQIPNGDYGPAHLMYRYRVSIPFSELHERDTRVMSNYRRAGTL